MVPGGSAWFAIGTATAYDPTILTFTEPSFAPAGAATSATLTVKINARASGPTGKPMPVGVTPTRQE